MTSKRNSASSSMDEILQDCLVGLSRGDSIAQCLARYPEHKGELEPMLVVSQATLRTASGIRFRAEAKARGLARLNAAALHRHARKLRRFAWLALSAPKLARPALVTAMVAVIASGTAFGATVASADSIPGDPLYWVKTTREDLSMKMPKSNVDKAKEHVQLARVRGTEMNRLVSSGNMEAAEQVAVRMTDHLTQSAVIVGINISINPTDMPYYQPKSGEAYELAKYVMREGKTLHDQYAFHLESLSYDDELKLRSQIWKCEMRYRAIIAALESDAPAWPFLMTKPTRSTRPW